MMRISILQMSSVKAGGGASISASQRDSLLKQTMTSQVGENAAILASNNLWREIKC